MPQLHLKKVNHLSHMLLLSLLYPSLEAASTQREEARVVFHTSMARMVVGMPKLMKEIMKDKTEGATKTIPSCAFAKAPREWPEEVKMFAKDDVVGTYGLSKACNFVCWAALHEKLLAKGSKVKSLIAHPGTAATDIFAKRFGKTFMTCIGNCMVRSSAHSDADGACPLLTCICAPPGSSTRPRARTRCSATSPRPRARRRRSSSQTGRKRL